ncbi:MAG: alpha/beta hydrolase family protein [Planctomycetaceae bacterium]
MLPTKLLRIVFFLVTVVLSCSQRGLGQGVEEPFQTERLTTEGDLASQMIDGLDRFLLGQIAAESVSRPARFVVDTSSAEGYERSLEGHRGKLIRSLGLRDSRKPFAAPEVVAEPGTPVLVAQSDVIQVEVIRWPVLGDPSPQGEGLTSTTGEGLLLTPRGEVRACVVVLPDADQTPEQLSGLVAEFPADQQIARILAEAGCRVVVPALISRQREKRLGRADLTQREYVHRAAFELGRTLAGYEIQGALAMVDWFRRAYPELPVAITGHGEGGMEALFAGAVDTRISVTGVSGFFGPREGSWREPVDRNFAGLLRDFGASELAMLCAPRQLLISAAAGPALTLAGNGGAPAILESPTREQASAELSRAVERLGALGKGHRVIEESGDAPAVVLAKEVCASLGIPAPAVNASGLRVESELLEARVSGRQRRLIQQLDRHNQLLLRESPFVRREFHSQRDLSSVGAYEKSSERYREIFRKDVIGEFAQPLLPFNARSRRSWETEKWTGHEVVLDVFPDVFAYGVLLLPKDLKPGEQRPVVVCQHGLEGRPTDVFLGDNPAYHDFAAKLCERGFITFAPQNPYIFTDRFRTLQRKAQPLGRSLFSLIVPQHQQIVNWLKTQPYVDPSRIAFYGLSYGGKSAMRIPALVTDYCLSICSADFNEWVLKNASTRHNFSYMWTGEYEIFEWDLGSTFNYAEMASLICPRPFMVERGHFDGVGEDDWVAFEYAKVQHLYAAQLKIGERTEIEWFVGPHTINGVGTYNFLHRHLRWPERK